MIYKFYSTENQILFLILSISHERLETFFSIFKFLNFGFDQRMSSIKPVITLFFYFNKHII